MAPLAFTTPFSGAVLNARSPRSYNTPRCEMASDSVAPKITLFNTGSDATSKVQVEWTVTPPNTADAFTVVANSALAISMRSKTTAPALPSAPAVCPPGVAPADFYFPKETRNLAPVVSLAYNESISVSYDKINPVVGGVAADSVESVAFWKTPSYKYSAPDAAPPQQQETISTAKFEAYFPSKVRNFAPAISMKPPAGDWDNSAFLQVGSEFVPLSADTARQLSIDIGQDAPSPRAAATVEKYFGDRIHMAPDISVQLKYSRVEFCLKEVPEPSEEAAAILAGARAE